MNACHRRRIDLIGIALLAVVFACSSDGVTEPGPPARLEFRSQPTTVIAGQALSPVVEVEIQDAAGQVVTSSNATVTLALSDTVGSLSGSTTVQAAQGVARFAGVSLTRAHQGYRLTASAANIGTITSATFDVNPGAAARLAVRAQPQSAGVLWPVLDPAVTVAIQDAYGNDLPNASNSVTATIAGGTTATLQGTTTRAAVNGVATFNDLRVDRAGQDLRLTVSATGLTSATSDPFLVRQGTLSTGDFYACALSVAGQAYCWGNNFFGQLGDGTTVERNVPTPAAAGFQFATIHAGRNHTCGLTSAGQAYCWGWNSQGQLGDGTRVNRLTPVQVTGGLTFSTITIGQAHTCGLTTSAEVYCWGVDEEASLGQGAAPGTVVLQPTRVSGGLQFMALSTGFLGSCALTNAGRAYCWGSGFDGRNGDGFETNRSVPTAVASSLVFRHIRTGSTSCATTSAGEAWCWGYNGEGATGNGTTAPVLIPARVSGTHNVLMVATRGNNVCGMTMVGGALCWGAGAFGAMGDGGTDNRLQPVSILPGRRIAMIGSGAGYACAQTTDGEILCWGRNGNGQLADGTLTNRPSAAPVSGGLRFR